MSKTLNFTILLLFLVLLIPELNIEAQNDSNWIFMDIENFEETISYSHPILLDYNPSLLGGPNGVVDVLSGRDSETGANLLFYENFGSNTNFQLVPAETGYFGATYFRSAPHAFDMNQDGLTDILVGESTGEVFFLVNDNNNMVGNATTTAYVSGVNVSPNTYAKPAVEDINGDSLPDIVVGTAEGELVLFYNNGTITQPDWVKDTEVFFGYDMGNHLAPSFYDANEDGNPDLIIGSESSGISVLLNQGIPEGQEFPIFNHIPFRNSGNFFGKVDYEDVEFLTPSLYDLNGDGDLDLITGAKTLGIQVFLNDGFPLEDMENIPESSSPLSPLLIVSAIVILFAAIGVTAYTVRRYSVKTGKPIYLMILHSIGISPYNFKFTEEQVSDTNLAGGAFSGIQSIISEITSSELNSLEAGENKILITRINFYNSEDNVQILLWATEDDKNLRELSFKLGEYIVNNFQEAFEKGLFEDKFREGVTRKIHQLFSKYIDKPITEQSQNVK